MVYSCKNLREDGWSEVHPTDKFAGNRNFQSKSRTPLKSLLTLSIKHFRNPQSPLTGQPWSEVFQSEVMPPINTQIAGRRVVSRLFDKGDGSRWHGTGADGDNQQGWLWYGAVEGAPTIDTALRALNVASELESLLLRQNVSPGEALSELAPLYDLAAGWIVKWQVGVPSLEIWHWSADTCLTSRQDLPVNQRFLGHDLSGDLAATFNVVWNGSQTISVDEALAKLERFLGNTNAVVAAVVEA